MPMILFAPAVFNLAETTRMIEVAKQMQGNHHCEFFGFSKTFASLIIESGFTYHLLTPTLTEKQEEQIIKLDQLRSFKNPFTKEMVAARILSEKTGRQACSSGDCNWIECHDLSICSQQTDSLSLRKTLCDE